MMLLPISVVLSAAKIMPFCCDGNFWRNPAPHSPQSRGVGDAKLYTPLFHRLRNAVDCGKQCISAVVDLLHISGPPAIRWLVIAIVINPIKRVFAGRLSSHISKEVLERIKPAITNSDPSFSIQVIPRGRRICAPHFHGCPCAIFGRSGSTVLNHSLHIKAAARPDFQILQVLAAGLCRVAAVALALPAHAPVFVRQSLCNDKSSIAVSGYVREVCLPHMSPRGVIKCH